MSDTESETGSESRPDTEAEIVPESGLEGGSADEPPRRIGDGTWGIFGLILACSGGALAYRLLISHDLGRTSAMFVGIPAVLAILLASTPKAKSLIGGIVKGITLFLLIVAPLLGEGYLCILIASPIFYLVGIVVGLIVDQSKKHARYKGTLSCVGLVLLPMCLEGVVPRMSFSHEQTVEATTVVNAPAEAVEAALAQSPNLATPLPRLLRIGFPRPLAATGSGLAVGSMRRIHFAGAEGDPPGDLISRVAERRTGFVRMETVSDSSKLTQWIRWDRSEVEWKQVDEGHTSVTWRIRFERELDPAWYFTPWERVAVQQAAEYMIHANATPRDDLHGRGKP